MWFPATLFNTKSHPPDSVLVSQHCPSGVLTLTCQYFLLCFSALTDRMGVTGVTEGDTVFVLFTTLYPEALLKQVLAHDSC